jgi:hypothetical protein
VCSVGPIGPLETCCIVSHMSLMENRAVALQSLVE